MTVRPYRAEDEDSLLPLWCAAVPYDPIDRKTFHRKVLLDPNFDREGLLLADAKGDCVGFILSLVRKVPMEKVGLEEDKGWITAFGVHPDWRRQGIGHRLMEASLDFFEKRQRKQILVSPYTPNYFVPGIDEDRYRDAVRFLEGWGFKTISRPISMDANIVLFDYTPYRDREKRLSEEGVQVRSLKPNEIPLLLSFLREHMPGDWLRHCRDLLTDVTKGIGDYDQFIVALYKGRVVGWCQFEGEHFGPYGVVEDMRGKGIGTLLMAKCLAKMRQKGHHNAWVLWTSEETAEKVYSRFGFRKIRQFAVMRKDL